MLFEGWWLAFGYSGLWLSFGVLIWMLLRDRRRKKLEREERVRRMMEAVLGAEKPSVEQLEKEYEKKG